MSLCRFIKKLVLLAVTAAAGFCAAADSRPTVTIGLIDTFSPEFYIYTFSPTIDHLIKTLPEFNFRIVEIDPENAEAEIKKYNPGFLLSSASAYVALMETKGAHQVATRELKTSPDVAHTVASTFIVPEESPIRTLEQARGKSAAISSVNSFNGWLIAKGEIAKLGDPERFFSRITETRHTFPDVVSLLKAGAAEIGVLASCDLEALIESGSIRRGEFRVINASGELMGCAKSTEAYPDAVFSSLPDVSSSVTRKVAVSLLTMPSEDRGFRWTIANDFLPTYHLLKQLQLGPFKPVPITSPEAFFAQYRYEILVVLLLIFLLIAHSLYTNALVRKRTSQLRTAMEDMERFHQEAKETREKLDSMERLSIVSQLSSLFAHEIKQPITNISYYAGSLLMYLKHQGIQNGPANEIVDAIQSEVQRSSGIIEQVRSYAKKRTKLVEVFDLKDAVQEAAKFNPHPALTVKASEGSLVCADKFEVEFIAANFIKNAIAAVEKVKNPRIVLQVEDEGERWRLSVIDNGPEIPDEEVVRLGVVGHSTKIEGLGWGLFIASAMAESNGGHLEFQKIPGGGLKASLLLSKYRNNTEEKKKDEKRTSGQTH